MPVLRDVSVYAFTYTSQRNDFHPGGPYTGHFPLYTCTDKVEVHFLPFSESATVMKRIWVIFYITGMFSGLEVIDHICVITYGLEVFGYCH